MLLPLMVAALGHYLANSLGVAALTALSRRQRILETWRDHYLWASITYFSGAAAAALVFSLRHKAGWTSIGLSLPILSVTYFAYRVYLGKLAERQKYAEQILEINAGLELRIAERTSAIESVNQELATKNRELEKVSKMKAEFLAKMSHELRTPLNAIIGFSELLLHPRGRNFDEQQRAAFHQDILASGAHLLSLINDILDISKIEAGRTSFLPQLCELRPLIKKAISDFSPMAQAKGVQLTFSVHPLLQYVHLDPPKLTQILNNLISNAIKFTHSEGKVSVWVDAELPRTLVVQVVDNGIGIPAECQDKIFEAFYQVEASYSRSQDGSGLGLALVRELAHMHGGTASVESQPGVGSRFTVHLPGAVALEEESAAERPEKEIEESKIVPLHGRPAAQSAPLVLLVEDHPANARLATELLLGAGMEVLLATTAEEAFQLLRHHRRPSFILMDISLPRMDGLEATRRLRLDPELRDIPVIAVTAHAMTGDRERALEAGCIEHVSKPLDIEALYQVLQRVLDRTA
jgi:signal transduction histidine kinase/CheY-like chemotaxis protein